MQPKPSRQIVDGVLLLDKTTGITSNAALQTARRLFNAAKAGHTGTLDPMASGLLPLTFGEATKFSQMLLDADKTYEATVRFGIETDSGDAEGSIIAQHPVNLSTNAIENALLNLRGEVQQIPPMFSALKHQGRPLYEYARAGIEIERKARNVTIHTLDLLDFSNNICRIRTHCSKGTYIRSLAIDIGRALGCGAHLTALRRTQIGPFQITDTKTLTEIETQSHTARPALLLPVDALTQHLTAISLSPEQTQAFLHGQPLVLSQTGQGLLRVYHEQHFLGLAYWHKDGKLYPKRLIATQNMLTSRIKD